MAQFLNVKTLSLENKRKFHRLLLYFLATALLLVATLSVYYLWLTHRENSFSVTFSEVDSTPSALQSYGLSFLQSETWEQNGPELLGAQYDFIITNNSRYPITDWSLSITTNEIVYIDSYWNGDFTQDGNVITITPADYNPVIATDKSISVGAILHTSPDVKVIGGTLSARRDRPPTQDPIFRFLHTLTRVVIIAYIVGLFFQLRILYISSRKDRYRDLLIQSLNTISGTIDAKDRYTQGHSKRVAIYSRTLAKRLGLSEDEQENIYYIGLMHDIGKIGVPDHILNKTSALTDEEFDVIRTHTTIGASILEDFTLIPEIADGAKYHHERFDGKGYPTGLSATDIPYVARIICVADSYDAMASSRCYRKELSTEDIITELKRCSGTQFDPKIVDELLDMIEKKEVPVTLP